MEHNPKKFEKQFFLFGEEITGIAECCGIERAIEAAKIDNIGFEIYCWDENSSPVELLATYGGYEYFKVITEEEYKEFEAIQ